MASSLTEMQVDNSDPVFYSDNFKDILEQNLEYIKSSSSDPTGMLQVGQLSDAEAVACEGDFRKVAAYLKIPLHLVWVTARVNDLISYEDYTRELRDIIIPDFTIVYKLQLATAITQTNI